MLDGTIEFHFRILTQNLWHGLDHTNMNVMWPTESPSARKRRNASLVEGLKSLLPASPNALSFFCLQEVNPVLRLGRNLGQELGMEVASSDINVGVRVGPFSYPFYLQEGLANLWKGPLEQKRSRRLVLSGNCADFLLPKLKIPVTLQFGERRGALITTGIWQGLKICVLNTHLHHGPPAEGASERRLRELETALRESKRERDNSDLVFLAGDFNCEPIHSEFQYILQQGFAEISVPRRGASPSSMLTWDPRNNPICKKTSSLSSSDAATEWDACEHQFDHIFFKSQKPLQNLRVDARRVLDTDAFGSWISDHYGLCVDLSWTPF